MQFEVRQSTYQPSLKHHIRDIKVPDMGRFTLARIVFLVVKLIRGPSTRSSVEHAQAIGIYAKIMSWKVEMNQTNRNCDFFVGIMLFISAVLYIGAYF